MISSISQQISRGYFCALFGILFVVRFNCDCNCRSPPPLNWSCTTCGSLLIIIIETFADVSIVVSMEAVE